MTNVERNTYYKGENLKKFLTIAGISREDFIKQMGWASLSQMSSFMNGNPTAKSLSKAASILGISVNSFFEESEEKVTNYYYGYNVNASRDVNYNTESNKMAGVLEKALSDLSKSNEIAYKLISKLEQELEQANEEIANLRAKLNL